MPASSGHGGLFHLEAKDDGTYEPMILFRLLVEPSRNLAAVGDITFQLPGKDDETFVVSQGDNDTDPLTWMPVAGEELSVFGHNTFVKGNVKSMRHPLFGLNLAKELDGQPSVQGKCVLSAVDAGTTVEDVIDYAIFRTTGGTQTLTFNDSKGLAGQDAGITITTNDAEEGYLAVILYSFPSITGSNGGQFPLKGVANGFVQPTSACYVYIAYARPESGKNDPNLTSSSSQAWADKLTSLDIDFNRLAEIMGAPPPSSREEIKVYLASIRSKKPTGLYKSLWVSPADRLGDFNGSVVRLDASHIPTGDTDYPSGIYMLGKEVSVQNQVVPTNINTASAPELMALPGIGAVYAQSIIENRRYETIDEIMTVPGIGTKTYAKLVYSIIV